jgi:MFS transporter, PAT family, beta-lactamase induction signal transducer AmpG
LARSKKALPWVFSTYFGEGLPWSFLHQMATEYLTEIRVSMTMVAATSWLHLAVTLKFLWAPIVDLFGRKRTWVILTQIVLGLAMFVVAAIAPSRNMTLFWAALGVLAIIHATHDIACDGFYLQALDRKQQALFAGARLAAFRTATLVGASVLVALAGQRGWLLGFGLAGALMILVAVVNHVLMPVPPEHHPQEDLPNPEAPQSKARAFFEAFRTFLTQPNAVLVLSFLLLYRLGDIMMFAMSKPLLRDLGVTTSQRGLLNGLGAFATITGSIVGGIMISRIGLRRCLIPLTYLQNLAIPLYIGLAVLKPKLPGIIPIVLAEQFVAGIGATNFSVFQMQRTRKAFSASHFAFTTAIVALAATLSGVISGPLNEKLGHELFFTLTFVVSIPSLILVLFVPKAPIEPESPPANA